VLSHTDQNSKRAKFDKPSEKYILRSALRPCIIASDKSYDTHSTVTRKQTQIIMKRYHYIFALLMAPLLLTACQDQEMQLHGKMTTIKHMGKTCWVFQDDNHNKYEVITPSVELLRENLQMSIRAFEVKSKTLCDLPTVIEVFEYRPDFSKDR
jgi:hypothetical protein